MYSETTTIEAKKDLHNMGLCFKKGHRYTVDKLIKTEAGLMDVMITNEQGQPHIIGGWWRNFKIIN